MALVCIPIELFLNRRIRREAALARHPAVRQEVVVDEEAKKNSALRQQAALNVKAESRRVAEEDRRLGALAEQEKALSMNREWQGTGRALASGVATARSLHSLRDRSAAAAAAGGSASTVVDEEPADAPHRAMRQVKLEQDRELRRVQAEEYARSLRQDERRDAERAATHRAEDLAARAAAERQLRRERLRETLEAEPGDDVPASDVCKLCVRLPDGRRAVRRFRAGGTVQLVYDFVTVEGFHDDEYQLCTSFPRRPLAPTQTLRGAGLLPGATIVCEALN